jgi:sec-independent protein translocase protein TatA
MPFGIGVTELLILLVVVLLVFGPKRLPEMGRSLGRGMREFKDSIAGKDDDEEQRHAQLSSPQADVVTPTSSAREQDPVS